MDFQQYIKPELLILVPVLYIIGVFLRKSNMNNKYIPLILSGASIFLSGLWVFSTCTLELSCILVAIFTSVTQGILIAATAVYANQIYKQIKK